MGAGVAFQAPVIMRPNPPAPRAPTGTPGKPPVTGTRTQIPTSLPGFPGIPVFQVPRTIIQGITSRAGVPVPTRPTTRPGATTIVDYGMPPSQSSVLTGPIGGPGITDTGFSPPGPPPVSAGGGGGGGGGDGGGSGGVTVAARAHIPWLTIALVAGGLYLVTRS